MNRQNASRRMRSVAGVTALTLLMLPGFASSQEVVNGGAKQNGHQDKQAMQDMPRISEKNVLTVSGDENWDETLGFGTDSQMAEMMILMMVGGSGMEHMKMGAMKPGMKMTGMAAPGAMESHGLPVTVTLKPNPPIVGDNTMDVLVVDSGGKPVTGIKLMAAVAMTSMDMGTTKPKVTEAKDGHYTVTVNFSMKGPWRVVLLSDAKGDKANSVHSTLDFTVDGKTKWTAPKAATSQTGGWQITVNTDPKTLKVGKNPLDVTILDPAGKPVTGAKVTLSVEMTSMDMGITKPAAKESKNGHYTSEVEFSMKGPWRVTATVVASKQKPFTKAFDFNIPK